MPSSPKSFYARPPSYSRRSTALILSLLIGLSTIFGLVAVSRRALGNKCKFDKPLSVSVAWDRSSTGTSRSSGDLTSDERPKRHKVMGFVGIQTGFGSAGRRRSLRQTWFPSDRQGLQRYILEFLSFFL